MSSLPYILCSVSNQTCTGVDVARGLNFDSEAQNFHLWGDDYALHMGL